MVKTRLQIPVRALVEYVFRSGDLELTFFGASHPVEAIRIHQKIQKSRPKEYTGEVPVTHRVETGKYILEITGRIDGIFIYPDRVIIEEIKTTTGNLDLVEQADNPFHWGQAKTYACMYTAEHDLDVIDVQVTYFQLDSGEIREIRRTFVRDDLEIFFQSVITQYLSWAETIAEWCLLRDESIHELEFPFTTYRSGQRQMTAEVCTAIRNGEQLIVQAPTGIGKTMAALFPAVKAIGERFTEKVFYLTARTTGKTVAEKALDILREHGLRLKSLSLTAKEKICFNPGRACNGEECEFARGHFDRVNGALTDAFTGDTFTRETIAEIARKHQVCPFAFSLDLSLWADCIICDYNYAFDPRVYLRRFFLEESWAYTFLIDEAHNLVDRACDMFSAELLKQPFLDLRRSVRQELPYLTRILGNINAWLVKMRKRCEEEGNPLAEHEQPVDLYPSLRKFITAADRWLRLNIRTPFRNELIELYFTVTGFLKVAEHYDECYATCYEKREKDLMVKLFCMNPAVQMKDALARCRAAVFFSATMVPTDYFRTILGCENSARELILPSPFPQENLCILADDRISTLYRNRDRTKSAVAHAMATLVKEQRGNYLMFFPSYEYMLSVYDLFTEISPATDTIVQTRGMTEDERETFLERFAHDNTGTLAGFAVMGGIFGEGIDLIGDRLTGAVIVGVGLPGISLERELIRDYFARHHGRGYDFAYLYPGINKVFQAAGRVIRSETDRGVILLIDERFSTPVYKSLFPREWSPVRVKDEEEIRNKLRRFWNE